MVLGTGLKGWRLVAAWQLAVLPVAVLAMPHRAQAASETVPAVSGTSETTYIARDFAPARVAAAIGRYRVVARWSMQDASHWRLDSRTVQPALQAQEETVVANGSSIVWYTSLYRRAMSFPQPVGSTPIGLEYAMTGTFGAEAEAQGSAYYAAEAAKPGSGVRSLGQATVLGRTADIYQIEPLYGGTESYGRAIFWLDHQYPLVLRLELHDMKPASGDPEHWVYRVTSLQFGQGPLPRELAYQPPVPASSPPQSTTSSRTSGYGSSERWMVPAGFIAMANPRGYALTGSGQEGDITAGNGPSWIDALFWRGKTFIYVEQQLRRLPLPAALRHHPPVRVGRCAVRIGHFWHQHLSWAAFKRGHVALLAVSNGVGPLPLARLAGAGTCAPAPVSS